jgi:hypothetical protein
VACCLSSRRRWGTTVILTMVDEGGKGERLREKGTMGTGLGSRGRDVDLQEERLRSTLSTHAIPRNGAPDVPAKLLAEKGQRLKQDGAVAALAGLPPPAAAAPAAAPAAAAPTLGKPPKGSPGIASDYTCNRRHENRSLQLTSALLTAPTPLPLRPPGRRWACGPWRRPPAGHCAAGAAAACCRSQPARRKGASRCGDQ